LNFKTITIFRKYGDGDKGLPDAVGTGIAVGGWGG